MSFITHLTPKQEDILRLCATQDDYGNTGIAPEFHAHFKVGSKRVLNALERAGLVERDAYNFMVATDAGRALLDTQTEK